MMIVSTKARNKFFSPNSISIIPEEKERHVEPGENNINHTKQLPAMDCSGQSVVFQDRTLSYLPLSTSDKPGGQTMKNFNNGGANNNALPRQTSSRRQLLQSISNDGSLGESNCCVGKFNIKITGDHFELVQMAKLVLDDYFRSNEFLQSAAYNKMISSTSNSTPTMTEKDMIPISRLKSSSPFTDNSIGLTIENVSTISNANESATTVADYKDLCAVPETIPIFYKYEPLRLPREYSTPTGEMITDTKVSCAVPIINSSTRSRRTHFSLKDIEGEMIITDNKVLSAVPMICKSEQLRITRKDTPTGEMTTGTKKQSSLPIIHRNETLKQYSKTPLSLMLPKDWMEISKKCPSIVQTYKQQQQNQQQ